MCSSPYLSSLLQRLLRGHRVRQRERGEPCPADVPAGIVVKGPQITTTFGSLPGVGRVPLLGLTSGGPRMVDAAAANGGATIGKNSLLSSLVLPVHCDLDLILT